MRWGWSQVCVQPVIQAFGYVGRRSEQAGTAGTSCRRMGRRGEEGYVERYRKRESVWQRESVWGEGIGKKEEEEEKGAEGGRNEVKRGELSSDWPTPAPDSFGLPLLSLSLYISPYLLALCCVIGWKKVGKKSMLGKFCLKGVILRILRVILPLWSWVLVLHIVRGPECGEPVFACWLVVKRPCFSLVTLLCSHEIFSKCYISWRQEVWKCVNWPSPSRPPSQVSRRSSALASASCSVQRSICLTEMCFVFFSNWENIFHPKGY